MQLLEAIQQASESAYEEDAPVVVFQNASGWVFKDLEAGDMPPAKGIWFEVNSSGPDKEHLAWVYEHALTTPIILVLDEHGVNMENGQYRDIDGVARLYVDDVNGYEIITD